MDYFANYSALIKYTDLYNDEPNDDEFIVYDKKHNIVQYHLNGFPHNKKGPAHVEFATDGKIQYCTYAQYGLLHRKNAPSVISYCNGTIQYEIYYINGDLHREDGPAYITYYENGKIRTESYYKNDLLHREDGPAYIVYNEEGSILEEHYYWKSMKCSKVQFMNITKKI